MGSKNKSKGNKNAKQANNSGDPTPPPPAVSKHHGPRKKGAITTDPRFAAVQSDPRFQKVPQREKKVAIDARFERVFTDKRFAPSSAPVDKRGKRRQEKSSRDSINDFYRIEKENIGKTAKAKKRDSEEDSEAEEESESEKLPKIRRQEKEEEEEEEASGSESGSESEEEESGDRDEEASTEEEDDDAVLEDVEPDLLEEDIQTIEKETHRLAVVNMDWRHIKAVDLYVMLSSFLPKDGQIKSVAVYPSEFGLQRMKEEEVHGPVGLFDDENETKDEDGEDAAEEEGSDSDSDSDEADVYEDDSDEQYEDSKNGEEKEGSDDDDNDEYDDDNDDADGTTHHDDEEIDGEKLRAYEMSKLRYYFAVVECDSSATADHLYKACDGTEFERSSNVLDLRFIPDSMEFKHPPRDVATEAPGKYEGANFQTRALQLSKIHLTWDEDEPERVKTLRQNFNADQLAELELNEFLASDESDDEEEDDTEDQNVKKQKKRDKYRALIESADGGDEDDDKDDENGGQDMEVTFNTGLEDLSKRILEKKDNKSESVWEAYLKKKREKKRARKDKFNKDSEDDDSSDPDDHQAAKEDDFFLEEPPVKKSKKETRGRTDKREKQEETKKEVEASTAELELLVSDDEENAPKGYNLKRKKPKGKKGKETYEDKIPDSDFNDQRFSALFTSSNFALDPTDPQFKRSAVYARQVAQRRQKSDKEEPVRTEPIDLPTKEDHTKSESTSKKEKQELSSLVKSVKLKNLDWQSSKKTQSVKKAKVRK